jgi:hypothetical protein
MPPADDLPVRKLPDHLFRQTLKHPANLRAFLEEAVPHLAPGFDCPRARLMEREFPLDDWRNREADLPFEIPYRTGSEEVLALVCVLIEHQSDTDLVMPLRMLYFAVVYWERQWHEWERQPRPKPALNLRPVLPIVLYTGGVPWGSNRTLADLLGEPAAFHAYAPAWQPLFWNLADQSPEALLDSGREWLQALAVIRAEGAATEAFAAVYEEALRRLEALAGRDHVQWYDLLRAILTWAAARRPKAERTRWLEAAKASQADAARRQEVQTMGQTIAEALIEEGIEKGQLLNARTVLRDLLQAHFGSLPEPLLRRIEAATDLQRLRAAILTVSSLKTLDELQL